jgi:hypothetical protein
MEIGKLSDISASEITAELAGKADIEDIPNELSDLTEDANNRTVSDTQITNWNNKADQSFAIAMAIAL